METRSNHVLVGTVTLLLLAAIMIAAFWFSRLSQGDNKEYDIFFKQSVSGLAKGSGVNYAGVPSGQVERIELWKRDPSFVKVRISVRDGTPILQGTTATIQGVGFTGVSEIVLDGAVKGAPPIVCPPRNTTAACPDGTPVIPTKPGALGELLNNAPQLLERLSTLTERLTELLNDKNQQSIAGILANVERISGSLADRSPEISATLAEARIAVQRTGVAVEDVWVPLAPLAGTPPKRIRWSVDQVSYLRRSRTVQQPVLHLRVNEYRGRSIERHRSTDVVQHNLRKRTVTHRAETF